MLRWPSRLDFIYVVQGQEVIVQEVEDLPRYLENNNTIKVTQIIENNPGVLNAPLAGTSDETALGRCASKGNYGMCRLLLKLGANPDIMSGNRTPLMVASLVNNIQIVELLLESKANPLIYTKDRLNALDFAIMAGNYSIALLFTKSKNMKPTYKPKEYLANANVSEIGYYVNYQKLLDCLEKRKSEFEIPDLYEHSQLPNLSEPSIQQSHSQQMVAPLSNSQMYDPVIDPREKWSHLVLRLLRCKSPPLVQRNSLPEELQPQNRLLGKIHFYLNRIKPYRNQRRLSLEPKNQHTISLESTNSKDVTR